MNTKRIPKDNHATCFPSDWFNEMPTPIFILDETGSILYANNSFCDLIKKRKNKCQSVKPLDMMIDEQENKKFLKDLLQVYRGVPINRKIYKLCIAHKDFNALLDITPVYDSKKKLVQYAVGVVLDHDAKNGLRRLREIFG
jgi:transcriptional regulator of aromatic amino acid metabolism